MRKILIFSRSLYLFLAVLCFYLLVLSRSGEVYTVWEVMHPMFIPTFFVTTLLLVTIIFSPERTKHKLLFIIIHSILSHSFFAIVFPAGNIVFQQSVLGITRRIFDNLSPHGWGGTAENTIVQIYNWFDKPNFQSVYSVMFARMFSVDVFWSHLFLVPVLWGSFIPTITFMITKTLGGDERISALSGLLGSAFPLLVYSGTISIPSSLGCIFFLGSVFFFLKYMTSKSSKFIYSMMIFTFASFLSHFLTGTISFSFLLMAYTLKKYEREKSDFPSFAKLLLFSTFILSTSLLPFALAYYRIFTPVSAYFTMDKIYEYTTAELLGQFLLGDYFYYSPHVTLIYMAGPLIASIWAVYKLYTTRNQKPSNTRVYILFLFLGFLMLWIDYCILKIFMINVPFDEERLWVFRDLLSLPLAALALNELPTFLRSAASSQAATFLRVHKRSLFLISNILMSILLAGWVALSVTDAYPHHSLLQTTSYELEAVEYIDKTTNNSYIVICDFWISYAGQMIVGAYNQRAYYFGEGDALGAALFIKMKDNPSPEVMIEAMNYTEVEIGYFIITKPRRGEEEYNRIIQQAQQNNLPTYRIYYYRGEEKLRIFYWKKNE